VVTGQLLRLAHTSRGIVKQRLRALLGSAPETPGPAPAYWRLEADASGTLSLQGRALHELRKQFGSPLQIVNAERLRDNAGSFLAAARSGGRCEIFYSYKTNPVPGVLSELHALGIGAERRFSVTFACSTSIIARNSPRSRASPASWDAGLAWDCA
jgi:diaminopimelate decarboxylase